jgi:hypothetical protein
MFVPVKEGEMEDRRTADTINTVSTGRRERNTGTLWKHR